MDTETEKMGLDHSLSVAEQNKQRLEEDLDELTKERTEMQETLSQVGLFL